MAVVIPTYNHAHFLGYALDSALEQTVPVAEIVVVDDGSTDRPDAVVAHYPGVRLVRQENHGLAAARNTGLAASTSPHIVFLDADDRLRPEAIERNLELLARDPEAAFVYGGYCNVYADEGGRTSAPIFDAVVREAFGAFLRGNPIGMHAAVMYRRAPLEAIGGFRVELPACEDYDAYLRLAMRHPVACRPEVLAEYWQHGGNVSRDAAFMLRWALDVLQRYRLCAERAGLGKDYVAGMAGWKQYYASTWLASAHRLGPGRLDIGHIRQGLAIFRLAPRQLGGAVARALARRLSRRPGR